MTDTLTLWVLIAAAVVCWFALSAVLGTVVGHVIDWGTEPDRTVTDRKETTR